MPAEAALGGGSSAAYVDGLHQAAGAGALLALAGAVAVVAHPPAPHRHG